MKRMVNKDCSLCQKISNLKSIGSSLFIHEFEYSYLFLGDHQFYRGYSLLIAKQHARELHELKFSVRSSVFNELMIAGQAISCVYLPWKMNYASYGNIVEHVHWHIMPRYQADPNHTRDPFYNAGEFDKFPTRVNEVQNDIEIIRKNIARLNLGGDQIL